MKKSIFLFFAAILCSVSASAWSYKSAANSWKASTSGFTTVTMNSGKSVSVVMLKDVGDGVNICQNDDGGGQCLYCKWTKTSGDIFRGTARWNSGLYSDETVVVPGGKVYIKVGSGTQVQMTAGANYTYTADVTFSTTGQSYTISGGTVNGATIENQSSMPSAGKPKSLTMSNSYTSKNAGSVHIVFDLRTNKVTETAASEPDPEPEPTVTLYFVNHPEWTNLKAHVWDNNSTPYKDWNNSESMTNTGLDKDGYAVYSYTFPSKYTNIIFKGDGQQTQDNVAAYNVAKPYFCDDKWYASLAEIPALGAVVTYDYYVIGTVNGWALKDASYGMTDDNADGVYEKVVTLADGKNQMKINNGTWDNASTFGYDQLDAKYEGVSRGKDGDDNNIIIDITTGKDITVKFDKKANKITLDGLTKIEDYYTVVGVAELFGEAWATANEANKMVKQGDGSYKLVKENVTLAAIGYDWKIAKNGDWWNDAATGVNPAAGKNNTLTITTAGRYNVTFTLAADLKSATVETELLEAAVVIPDCFISGNKNLTGKETQWQGNEFTMVYDEATETWSYTLAGLQPEKAYELKVVCGGTWYSYADLASIPTGVTEGNDHSIAFKMEEAGDVTVTYNVEAGITLSGNFAIPVTYDYYIAGTLAGGWSAKQQGMTKDGDVYKHTFSELNADTYEFKITDGQFNSEGDNTHEHTTLGAAYEEVSYSDDGNIKIVTEEAINLTVIFNAATDKITFEGLTEKAPAEPAKCYLMGIGNDWTTGIEMEEDGDQFKLLRQPIAEGEQFKFKYGDTWSTEVENYEANGVNWVETSPGSGQYNITLPAGNYDFYYKKETNKVYIGKVDAPAVKSGKFSTGKYEYAEFAPGNLQYHTSNGTWHFAQNQYDYVGDANINVGDPNYKGWIDMFGWSADGKFGVNPSNKNEDYTGEFQDWGTKMGEGWSTLSADQWKYLLNTRPKATDLKHIARVGDVVGIMLFPDNWSKAQEVQAELDSYFNVNIYNYTTTQWTDLEASGAIFLPAAGRRTGGYENMINKDQVEETDPANLNGGHYKHQDNTNIYCYYWTSTINESTKDVSYLHNIQALGGDKYTIGTGAVWGEKGRYGQSVRLAKVTSTLIEIGDGNNSAVITENAEKTVNVQVNRTFEANKGYYTICLPFDLAAEKIGKALQINSVTENVAEQGMNVVFTEVTNLVAGQPYLVLPSENLTNPIFENVEIVNTTGETTATVTGAGINITFTGIINGVGEKTDGETEYYVGDKGWLYNGKVDKLGLRAFFTITDAAGQEVKNIRARVVTREDAATGFENITNGENTTIKLIENGQLIIIRNGEKFNAQGVRL